jgi:8-amino-7-oxononanoate synthase
VDDRRGIFESYARALSALDADGLLRRPPTGDTAELINFCSNDYLGFASAIAPAVESGSGASRLIAGDREIHRVLEQSLASWLGAEDALLFSSGFAANAGALAALLGPGDLLVSDTLNHASIIDGARLSRARVEVVPHNDIDAIASALRRRTEWRAWVAVESYYSMDADGPDLRELRAVCDRHGAGLYVDEAHALGVLGPGGRGMCAAHGILPDVLVGTFGKSFGSQGAFVAGPSVLREWLWNRARSFVFSTGLAPVCAASALRSIERIRSSPDLGAGVLDLAQRLRANLSDESPWRGASPPSRSASAAGRPSGAAGRSPPA